MQAIRNEMRQPSACVPMLAMPAVVKNPPALSHYCW